MSYVQKNLNAFGFTTQHSVYIVAEIGLNHHGDINTAKALIASAARTGVDAVKFQTYITEKRTFPQSPIYTVLKQCELPFHAFKELQEYAADTNVTFFSTPFDLESAAFLQSIDVPFFKIASFDIVNIPFLRALSAYAKPIIISVGMSSLKEIRTAYTILSRNAPAVSLLHCISAYPMKEEDANLSALYTLIHEFDTVIGYSDHTSTGIVPVYAVAAGAQIIEKHFRLTNDQNCVDADVSIDEPLMKQMVDQIRQCEIIRGNGDIAMSDAQKDSYQFRRYNR